MSSVYGVLKIELPLYRYLGAGENLMRRLF